MIQIELAQQPPAFTPGQAIRGQVIWNKLVEPVDKLVIRLIWYTTGKGDRDFAIAADQIMVSPPASESAEFDFRAPARPYSFSGKLISLSWAIEVIAFPDMETKRQDLVISANADEILLQHEY